MKTSRMAVRALAGIAAGALLAGMAVPAWAGNGGGGSGTGTGSGTGQGQGRIDWIYKDSYGKPTLANAKAALSKAGITAKASGDAAITEALTEANKECVTRSKQSGITNPNCRLVSVGYVHTPNGGGDGHDNYTGANGSFTTDQWNDAFTASGIPSKTWTYNGVKYKTSDVFSDGKTSINSIVLRETAKAPIAFVAIVLNQNEPKPADTPPSPPSKSIEKGTSADSMTNTTTISTGTGKGGTALRFKDTFRPNGVKYTLSNIRVTDVTAGNKNITGKFSVNTQSGKTPANNQLVVTWKKASGKLPDSHNLKLTFDVTVHTPGVSKVQDTGNVFWQGPSKQQDKDTDDHEFPTWDPHPDKSWVFRDPESGKWNAVIDPTHSNKTGADDHKFLDGDEVASVVNATVARNLIDAPSKFTVTDDWKAADYIFDASKASDIRVYEADMNAEDRTYVNNIADTGKDVTSQFTITVNDTKATATAKPAYLARLKGMAKAKQVTMLVPGRINFANGAGAEQVRKDFNKKAGDELTFCTAPKDGQAGQDLTNSANETINAASKDTNTPRICGYIPPVLKDVVSESSEGGDQESVQGKVVQPGQKVEYQLDTQPKLPADLAYEIRNVGFTDSYDKYLKPDKQTLEMMDLNTGRSIPKSKYTTKWDDEAHMFALTVTDKTLLDEWKAAGNPRVQIRFEGTVADDAPTAHKVNNKWILTLNNSLTPSNEVFNTPPLLEPHKEDTQKDPTISIDGKTAMLGDVIYYRVSIDARQTDQAYKVWRLGMTDDYDDEYLTADQSNVEITDETGKDVTAKFNIQDKDGVMYAYAKTVDTEVPATGETVKGDPQPTDLKAYSESDDHDALTQPAIDQNLLGHTYTVTMPMTVSKVTDGYVVRNTATEVLNKLRKQTNEVTNPLKPINPTKDVTVKVGGASADGQSVWLNSTFLYQLDSSVIPADRAYPQVTKWSIEDSLDPAYDQYTGQWAVYAQRDLYKTATPRDGQAAAAKGEKIAAKGEKIAGSDFDSTRFGGDLLTLTTKTVDGRNLVTVEATDLYKALVSADNAHEAGWRAYIQCKRVKTTARHENRFTEHYNDKDLESNVVWTRTPDLTPAISIEKWDRKSGFPKGDRDSSKDALTVEGDTEIVFTIRNTSKTDPETKQGAVFRTKDLKLEDSTIVGDGEVKDIRYPADWNTKVLKPGESVEVTGTLKGVTKTHTDRAKVTGTPLTECPVVDDDPFGDGKDGQTTAKPAGAVTIDGRDYCEDTKVESNQDDWNGMAKPTPAKPATLAKTGAGIAAIAGVALAALAAGIAATTVKRRKAAHAGSTSGDGDDEE